MNEYVVVYYIQMTTDVRIRLWTMTTTTHLTPLTV